MLTKEKYCAVCGCLFSLPLIRNPESPDPNEDPMLPLNDPYDSRLLPAELAAWLTNFRLVGRWHGIHPLFVNQSSKPNFFFSGPATWKYRTTLEPAIPTTEGKTEKLPVYESTDEENGMLFPIHQACLDIVDHLCERRKDHDTKEPKTLEDFCDLLELRRRVNFNDSRKIMEDQYYANQGGLEWTHGYYGARQFWADEWETLPGWEMLCADPASMKIPDLTSFMLAKILAASPDEPRPDIGGSASIDWLFPEEAQDIDRKDSGYRHWIKGARLMQDSTEQASDQERGEPQRSTEMSAVPLGLRNRWRIWTVLEHINEE